MRRLLAMCVFSLAIAGAAFAQCPAPTQPVVLPVVTPGVQFTGSTRLAADDGVVVTDYITIGAMPIVQIHRLDPTGWRLDGTINSPAGVLGLAIRGDTLIVRSGAAMALHLSLYQRDPQGNVWRPTDTISVSSPTDTAFGQGLTFDASSTNFVFRSSGDPDRVLVYATGGDGAAVLLQAIDDPEPAPNHSFGFDSAMDDDLLAVGAPGDSISGPHAGAVYLFQRRDGEWVYIQKLIPPFTAASTHFGHSLSMHDGTLVVGALHSSGIAGDVGGISFADGFARVYSFNGSTFDLAAHLTHPTDPQGTTAFGHDVAIRGNRLLVAAFQDDLTGSRAGAALIYDRVNGAWQSSSAFALVGGANGWFGSAIALTSGHAFGVAPLLSQGSVAAAVFDPCAARPLPPVIFACTPGMQGLFGFLGLYFRADPTADYNRDRTISNVDLVSYLQDWFNGCP